MTGGVSTAEVISMIEVKCNECVNCTGDSCRKYGSNANEAVVACANDSFKNYKKKKQK
mgnify:CR=1 FL=1